MGWWSRSKFRASGLRPSWAGRRPALWTWLSDHPGPGPLPDEDPQFNPRVRPPLPPGCTLEGKPIPVPDATWDRRSLERSEDRPAPVPPELHAFLTSDLPHLIDHIYEGFVGRRALEEIGNVLRSLRADSSVPPAAVREFAEWLVRNAPDRIPLKAGLAMLCVHPEREALRLLPPLESHPAFQAECRDVAEFLRRQEQP